VVYLCFWQLVHTKLKKAPERLYLRHADAPTPCAQGRLAEHGRPLVAHALQESSGSILSWARAAKPACELAPKAAPEGLELATFAGGCFWGLELAYQASSRACNLLTAGPQSCVCSKLVNRESCTGPSSAVSSRLLRLCHRLCCLPCRPACESRWRTAYCPHLARQTWKRRTPRRPVPACPHLPHLAAPPSSSNT